MGFFKQCFTSKWKTPTTIVVLFVIELAGTIATLALFGIAAPNLFRTNLWKDGALNGFNSDPNQILYAYANYEPIPKTPLIWSQFITTFNVVISVISMFVLLIKGVMWVMHMWIPFVSLVLHAFIVALWAFTTYAQVSPDYSDPAHPAKVPWYIAKSCDVTFNKAKNYHGCQMMKGTFAVTVIMLAVFALHLPLSIYSMIPGKHGKHNRMDSEESDMSMKPASMFRTELASVMGREKKTPQVQTATAPASTAQYPMTPRTLAFNTLSNDLPLRNR